MSKLKDCYNSYDGKIFYSDSSIADDELNPLGLSFS